MAEVSPWQPYIDDHLMRAPGDKMLTSAAIIGHDGLVWAQSDAFPELKPNEFDNIMRAFDDNASVLAQHGLFLGGVKYMVIKGEAGEVIRAKKGTAGVNIKKSISSLVFGIYDEPVTATECSTVVEKLGDYLIEQGY